MERKRVVDWVFPSVGDVLFLSVFFWTLYHGAGLLNDGDTGWHIVTGEGIIRDLKIPYADPYSHTMPGTPWTSHEWLAAVVLAAVHRLMGLNGVTVFTAMMISFTMFFLYRYMLYRKVGPLAAAFMTAIATSASTLHWLARPHAFSLPLTLAFIAILDAYQRDDKKYLKLLPLLMVLWVNLHAGFMLGLMLVYLYAGGNLLHFMLSENNRDASKARARKLGAIALATTVATFFNPHGPAILYFPFHLVGREYIMDNVLEWLSPNFHTNKPFEIMLLTCVTIFVLSRKKPDVFEGGAALLLTHMSLYSARYIPLMALIVTPMAAVRLSGAADRLLEGVKPGLIKRLAERVEKMSSGFAPLERRFNRRLWVYAASAFCLLVAANGGSLGELKVMDYRHSGKNFPVDAVEFAIKNDVSGNMFNNDGWGGYIIYRSFPRYRVFFDGRSDMFGVPFMKEYVKVARAEPGFEEVLDKYKVDWVIFNAGAPVCRLLQADGKWRLVYADATANIMLRDIPRNRSLIDKYKYARFVPKDEEG